MRSPHVDPWTPLSRLPRRGARGHEGGRRRPEGHRLAGAVRKLGLDPLDGHLYLFLSRSRQILGAITFDGSGWWVLCKRLELGSFGLPPISEGDRQVALEPHVLAALLHGLDPKGPRRRWYHRALR